MKLLCVYQSDTMPSSRIRILQMAPWLEAEGLQVDTLAYPEGRAERRALFARFKEYDRVWIQKKLPNFFESLAWRRCPVPLMFDFDDAICFRKDPKKGSYRSGARLRKFKNALTCASAVTAGNSYLASLAREHTQAPLMIYPSPVPTQVPVRRYPEAGKHTPVLGWIGGRGNLDSLASIAPQLAELNRVRPFILKVISDSPFEVPGLEVVNVPWSLETQERELTTFDIGLMPLDATSPFDQGKCAYKLLQYMAAGVAVMADGVGMNAEVVREGVNGCLAHERGEYVPILTAMLDGKPTDLARMGQAGRTLAQEHYGYAPLARELAHFFTSLI